MYKGKETLIQNSRQSLSAIYHYDIDYLLAAVYRTLFRHHLVLLCSDIL